MGICSLLSTGHFFWTLIYCLHFFDFFQGSTIKVTSSTKWNVSCKRSQFCILDQVKRVVLRATLKSQRSRIKKRKWTGTDKNYLGIRIFTIQNRQHSIKLESLRTFQFTFLFFLQMFVSKGNPKYQLLSCNKSVIISTRNFIYWHSGAWINSI